MKFNIDLLFVLLWGASSLQCETIVVQNSLDQAIVQAYIYANSEVDDIRLSAPLPFGSDENTPFPTINDASVVIRHAGKPYQLIASPGDSGYYHYPGTDLIVAEGETYELEFEYKGFIVSSRTTVPPPPANILVTGSEWVISPITSQIQRQQLAQLEPIELIWDVEADEYYYVSVKNLEPIPETFLQFSNTGSGPGGGGTARRFRMISAPFQQGNYTINPNQMEFYGLHQVVIYRVNQEYADLWESLEQDSRNLSEPLNNIHNGLGVFSAFNTDTVYFEIKKN